jgi:hypothetical protein
MRPLKAFAALLRELWLFARAHKKWWLLPLVLLLLLAGVFIMAFSSISPFIYSLF